MVPVSSFTLVRELAEFPRDKGLTRLLLALYETDTGHRYIALSEQRRDTNEADWVSARKGVTLRRAELQPAVAALSSADFDSKEDTSSLSHQAYASRLDWGPAPGCMQGMEWPSTRD